MCEHCEPYIEDGVEVVTALPTPEDHPDSAQAASARSGFWPQARKVGA